MARRRRAYSVAFSGPQALLQAVVTGECGLLTDLTTEITMAAVLSGSADITPDLTTEITFVSAISADGELSADLTTFSTIASEISLSADVSADLTTEIKLVSQITGGADLSCDLTTEISLASVLTGGVDLSPALTTEIPLAAVLTADGDMSADLLIQIDFDVVLSLSGDISVSLTTEITTAAVLSGDADIAADLSTGEKFDAVISVSCQVLADLMTGAVSGPKLLFSDLIDAPRSGWEGLSTKGAAVTVWGLNFGSTRGSSYVSIGGVQVDSANYVHWGNDANNARGLQSITFHLDSSMPLGAQNMIVVVNGEASRTISFYVRSTGAIRFINNADGNDSNDGTFSTDQGGGVGPWLTVQQAAPHANAGLSVGDIVYLKAGSGAYVDAGIIMEWRNDVGTSVNRTAIVGFPGEWPVIGNEAAGSNFVTIEGAGDMGYYVVSRIEFRSGQSAISGTGHHFRFIGLRFVNSLLSAAAGIIGQEPGWENNILGCYWENCGYDGLKHAIYFNSENADGTWKGHECENNEVGWCEFNDYSNDVGAALGGSVVEVKKKTSGDLDTRNIRIHGCLFRNCIAADPVWCTEVYDVFIVNNVFFNNAQQGVSTSKGSILTNNGSIVYFYNNTMYGEGHATNNGGIHFIRIRGADTVFSKNNIFYAIDTGGGVPEFVVIEAGEATAVFNSDYDIYFGNSVPSDAGSGTMNITNQITSDPQLVDPTDPVRDFHLQESSPAIDAGTDTSAVLDRDYEDNDRIVPYDIGSFEFVSETTTPIAAEILCEGNVSAGITTGIALASEVSLNGDLSAYLTGVELFQSVISANMDVAANLTAGIQFSSNVTGQVDASAAMTTEVRLFSVISNNGNVSSNLTTETRLKSQISIEGDLGALLRTGAVFEALINSSCNLVSNLTLEAGSPSCDDSLTVSPALTGTPSDPLIFNLALHAGETSLGGFMLGGFGLGGVDLPDNYPLDLEVSPSEDGSPQIAVPCKL